MLINPYRFGAAVAPLSIGPAAIDRGGNNVSGFTYIFLDTPCNKNGNITSVELWFVIDAANVVVGTMYGSGTDYTPRASSVLGSIGAGSKIITSGLSIAAQTGDFIAVTFTAGNIEWASSGGAGVYYKSGNQFGAGTQTYTLAANHIGSCHGIGA
jgi:hypothetical protein